MPCRTASDAAADAVGLRGTPRPADELGSCLVLHRPPHRLPAGRRRPQRRRADRRAPTRVAAGRTARRGSAATGAYAAEQASPTVAYTAIGAGSARATRAPTSSGRPSNTAPAEPRESHRRRGDRRHRPAASDERSRTASGVAVKLAVGRAHGRHGARLRSGATGERRPRVNVAGRIARTEPVASAADDRAGQRRARCTRAPAPPSQSVRPGPGGLRPAG